MESAEPLAALFFCQLDRRLKGDRRERGCGGQQPWNDAMKEGILIPDRSKHARIQHLPFSQHATQQFAKEEMIVCTGSWNPPSYHYTFRSILSKEKKGGVHQEFTRQLTTYYTLEKSPRQCRMHGSFPQCVGRGGKRVRWRCGPHALWYLTCFVIMARTRGPPLRQPAAAVQCAQAGRSTRKRCRGH